jgi:hypothetical protein
MRRVMLPKRVEMGHKIEVSRLAYYPQLAAILSRASV